jgi:protein-L-isoaspartate O-methyltransferase
MKTFLAFLVFLIPLPSHAYVLEHELSKYNGELFVSETNGVRTLTAKFGGKTILHSSFKVSNPTFCVDNYARVMSLITSLSQSRDQVFNIGLGGGVLPRFHFSKYPNAKVDSVELDPKVVSLAKQYFNLEHPNHSIITGDGAFILPQSTKKYDVIWVDAATPNGVANVFKTGAFQQTLRSHLEPDGIVIANLWERSAEELNQLVSTYKSGFVHGIRVKVPLAINDIIAVSNYAALTCDNFWDQYSRWYHSDDFPLKWVRQPDLRGSRICRELNKPH